VEIAEYLEQVIATAKHWGKEAGEAEGGRGKDPLREQHFGMKTAIRHLATMTGLPDADARVAVAWHEGYQEGVQKPTR